MSGSEGAQAQQCAWATWRYNVRRYHGKLLIKPSNAAVRHLRERLTAEVKALNGSNGTAVISKLNPIIRGWSVESLEPKR
jgi:hypothetical protein